jgi:anti-sigma regulatory factor (Ser/Thr protein kinase)
MATNERVTTVLPAVPPSVGAARRFVAASMRRHHALPETIDVACLLTSELVTNALVHAHSRVELTVFVGPTGFRIEVRDTSPATAQRRDIELDELSGRGLHIVDVMSSRWGTGPSGDGKRVWFELDASHLE